MYADDIQIYLDFNPTIPCDAECCLFRLSNCIRDVQAWMLANKLMLNENSFFIASSSHHSKRLELLTLTIDNTTINPVSSVRNLGVTFDNSMSMSQHVTGLCRSINYHIRNITMIRKYLDYDTCHSVVRALVLSRLDYCNSLLTGLKQHDLNRLQKLQNKAARLIHLKPKYSHVTPLLMDLHWLPVNQRIVFRTALNMYKTVSNIFPSYISDILDLSKPKREGLRSQSNLVVPRTSKKAGDRAFSIAGPQSWNSLPITIRNASSVEQFKRLLKTHLYNRTL